MPASDVASCPEARLAPRAASGLSKVLIIGSGPIVIGQAAEFDYAGTQACRALREAGIRVVLVNSNPATIMTDPEVADRVYIEPLVPEVLAGIIARERPQGLLATVGGQTALNLAVALHERGVLARYGVGVLGTPLEAVARAEDRALFKATMESLGEPLPPSRSAATVEEATDAAAAIGLPVVVRPAFTLGGSGGGIATTLDEVRAIARRGIRSSRIGQVLVERSVAGWKEVEYEVLRDAADNAIVVCNMENVDPMGVHTGDSIVVAPSQTLTDREYHRLRSAALRIVRGLGIVGACNVQFALDPASSAPGAVPRYYVIEVNPRVSRSSALASKATGYPIARVAAQIALGRRLDEIANAITGKTACFEPALDYVVVKIPRWPFDKFPGVERTLGTQMQSTGEAMALGRTFEEALMKAVRSLDVGALGLWHRMVDAWTDDDLHRRIRQPHEHRLFALAEALRRGLSVLALAEASGIDPFFIGAIARIVGAEQAARNWATAGRDEPSRNALGEGAAELRSLLRLGFDDRTIAHFSGCTPRDVRARRLALGLRPTYKCVDTCAGEFPAQTPYYYSTFEDEDEAPQAAGRTAVVLGSGPIRIGQGIEFDYCTVHAIQALKQAGWEAVVINNNPETLSTDFDISDRLYVEPLTPDDIRAVVEREGARGVLVQFGGQTPLNAAVPLAQVGVRLLGTSAESLDISEDRRKFAALLRELNIPQPSGWTAASLDEVMAIGAREGLPLLVRPSYVLGGRGMVIARTPEDLRDAALRALAGESGPVLLDRYLEGLEVELDAVADGTNLLIPALMEQIECAGVHSGDSLALLPARSVHPEIARVIVDYAARLSWALQVRGFLNIQLVIWQGQPYVLEVNLRASRTVPFVCKATGVPLVRLATEVMLGRSLAEFGYAGMTLLPPPDRWAVKAPVFSSGKLHGADPLLGPEMRSTGEVMGTGPTPAAALRQAFVAAGVPPAIERSLLLSVADRDKDGAAALAARAAAAGFEITATPGTAAALAARGVAAEPVEVTRAAVLVRDRRIGAVVNTPTRGWRPDRAGFALRRAAAEFGVPVFTSLDSAGAFIEAFAARQDES
ncbi:MAG: carbamoyl-phosphate synthase large subunit [Armatimonadota bacterium]|nr:carbamoyl-phosphate synthase large subunit [Armatimonadota bacterium]